MERETLDRHAFDSIRGLAILIVVSHHLARVFGNRIPFLMWIGSGSFAVALFFFMSGYGLVARHGGDDAYLDGFIGRVTKKLFLPFLTCFLPWLIYLICKGTFHLQEMIDAFILHGDVPLPNSWFVFELYVFYLFFWFANNWFRDGRSVWVCFFLVLMFFIVMIVLPGWKVYWWLTALAFPAGLIYRSYEKNFVEHRKVLVFLGVFALWIAYGVGRLFGGLVICSLMRVGWHCLVGVVCVLGLYSVAVRVRFLDWVGAQSYELYLVHGCLMILLQNLQAWPMFYVVTVFVISICVSSLFHNFLIWLNNKKSFRILQV